MKKKKKIDVAERQQELTTEVIGYLTDEQKAELGVYGWEILQALNLDHKNPEHVSSVGTVLLDCLQRGLLIKRKLALSTTEAVGPIFTEGLNQREKLVASLKAAVRSPEYKFFLTEAQTLLIIAASPLISDLTGLEQIKAELVKKEHTIVKFHSQLFDQSQLSNQANKLRAAIKASRSNDTDWQINSRLYANFLTHLAVYPYQRPSLEVEPKDLAVLAEMWVDNTVLLKSQQGLIEKMGILAQRLNIASDQVSLSAVEEYTKEVIGRIHNDIYGGTVNFDQLRGSFNLAFTSKTIQSELEEFEFDTKETVYLFPQEIDLALGNVKHYFEAHQKNFDLLKQDMSGKKLRKAMKDSKQSLSTMAGLELILVLTDSVVSEKVRTVNEIRDLRESLVAYVPNEVYIESLKFAYADNLKFQDSGEKIPAFGDEFVREKVKHMVFDHIIMLVRSGKVRLDVLIEDPSINFLTDLFNHISLKEFSKVDLKHLKEVGEDIFFKLLIREKVECDSAIFQLTFPVGAEYLEEYYNFLDNSTQESIKKKLIRQVQI